MKRSAALFGLLALLAVGCNGGEEGGWFNVDVDLSCEGCDLTGTWTGNIGDAAKGTFQISHDGTDLLIVGDAGYYAKGSNQDGELELRDRWGNEISGCCCTENEIFLSGPDGQTGKLTRTQ